MGTLLGELSTLALLEVEPLLAPTPSRVDSVIDRGKGILKSAGALSFICCSLNSFQISGSMTCSTTASAASMELLGVAEELVWKLEGSSLSPISTLGSQMQTFRYLGFHLYPFVCSKRSVLCCIGVLKDDAKRELLRVLLSFSGTFC